ncbi:MAG: tripartite tricarboxylate transporter substrate binding protein [Brooklawnia sp.]|jgi:tripartite-type tricarboxylate transporter receptor subunit TctC
MKRRTLLKASIIATALSLAACGESRTSTPDGSYPSQEIRLLVPDWARTALDHTARALADGLAAATGGAIRVDNPGDSAAEILQQVKDAPASGYVIGLTDSRIATEANLRPEHFDMIGQVFADPAVLSVPLDSPFTSLQDLIDAATSSQLTAAVPGGDAIWEIAVKSLADATRAGISAVIFDEDDSTAINAAMGNQTDAVISGLGIVDLHGISEGRRRALAVFSPEPHPGLPGVPTALEQGVDLEIGNWGGLVAPRGLPADVRHTLEQALTNSVEAVDFEGVLSHTGFIAARRGGVEFQRFAEAEAQRFTNP